MASIYGPVTDWATDFDHADPEYNAHAPEVWAELRDRCPVAHTDRYTGTWLPVTHEHVTQIAYDTEHFTSRAVVVVPFKPFAQAPIGNAPPISSDPPFHHEARRLLLPAFAPKVIEPWEKDIRNLCRSLLDAMGDADVVDAAIQYAQHIPVNVIALMLGFPLEDSDRFRGFVHEILEGVNVEPELRFAAFGRLADYLQIQIDDHIENPRNDLTTFLLDAKIGDQPLSIDHVRGTIVLLLLAGIDTTWSAIG
ncbi:MAG TPA: cytochrome P450, partial [Ilumatobacteraceae bacterium]